MIAHCSKGYFKVPEGKTPAEALKDKPAFYETKEELMGYVKPKKKVAQKSEAKVTKKKKVAKKKR